jgi:hypothetical protein
LVRSDIVSTSIRTDVIAAAQIAIETSVTHQHSELCISNAGAWLPPCANSGRSDSFRTASLVNGIRQCEYHQSRQASVSYLTLSRAPASISETANSIAGRMSSSDGMIWNPSHPLPNQHDPLSNGESSLASIGINTRRVSGDRIPIKAGFRKNDAFPPFMVAEVQASRFHSVHICSVGPLCERRADASNSSQHQVQ